MDDINTELKRQAVSLGLCGKWTDEWTEDWDTETLTSKMFEGITFCMKNGWPDKETVIGTLPAAFRRSHNIVADDTYSLLNPGKALVIGESSSNIRFNGISSGSVYVRDTSRVSVTAKGRARVFVRAYGRASIAASAEDAARIVIIRCSPGVSVKSTGNVIVRAPKE